MEAITRVAADTAVRTGLAVGFMEAYGITRRRKDSQMIAITVLASNVLPFPRASRSSRRYIAVADTVIYAALQRLIFGSVDFRRAISLGLADILAISTPNRFPSPIEWTAGYESRPLSPTYSPEQIGDWLAGQRVAKATRLGLQWQTPTTSSVDQWSGESPETTSVFDAQDAANGSYAYELDISQYDFPSPPSGIWVANNSKLFQSEPRVSPWLLGWLGRPFQWSVETSTIDAHAVAAALYAAGAFAASQVVGLIDVVGATVPFEEATTRATFDLDTTHSYAWTSRGETPIPIIPIAQNLKWSKAMALANTGPAGGYVTLVGREWITAQLTAARGTAAPVPLDDMLGDFAEGGAAFPAWFSTVADRWTL